MKSLSISLFVLVAAANASVPSLTAENYDELTNGKSVFIKFFSPKCPHCISLAPAWEKLSDDWLDHDIGMVAEVDCTGEGKALCDANRIQFFPSMKWGDPAGLEDYEGGRSYSDLSEFAAEHLQKPVCGVSNLDVCEPSKKQKLEAYMELSLDELKATIQVEEEKLDKVEKDFMDAVNKLQVEYQTLAEERDQAVSEIKGSGLNLMKSVARTKDKAVPKDEL